MHFFHKHGSLLAFTRIYNVANLESIYFSLCCSNLHALGRI